MEWRVEGTPVSSNKGSRVTSVSPNKGDKRVMLVSSHKGNRGLALFQSTRQVGFHPTRGTGGTPVHPTGKGLGVFLFHPTGEGMGETMFNPIRGYVGTPVSSNECTKGYPRFIRQVGKGIPPLSSNMCTTLEFIEVVSNTKEPQV